jgi:hypothetical protein
MRSHSGGCKGLEDPPVSKPWQMEKDQGIGTQPRGLGLHPYVLDVAGLASSLQELRKAWRHRGGMFCSLANLVA